MSELLAIFAKAPEAGRVKTRLVPPLTPEQAATVHSACLRDVVALATSISVDLRIFHDESPGSRDYFVAAFPETALSVQSAGDLGCRLADAFQRIFASGGAARAAIIGADSPTLPPKQLSDGFAAMRDHDVALGPTADGGYYLIAIRHEAWPIARALFEDIPWSTDRVLEETLSRAKAAGLQPRLLEPWYDIDRIEDLRLAQKHTPMESNLGRLLRRSGWGHL